MTRVFNKPMMNLLSMMKMMKITQIIKLESILPKKKDKLLNWGLKLPV